MSARVSIFESAFTDEHETIKVESGLKIREIENLDWKNCLIFANGEEVSEDYTLKENDIVSIRQFPSDSNVAKGAGWFFAPVTSLIHYFTSGSDEGAFNWLGNSIKNAILESFKQEGLSDSAEIGQTEQIPTITGAKNRSGANAVIPLLIGESMYTPITLAQSYTYIAGRDGEEQFFRGLYCLGYKDIDLKSVSLGIYKLSVDEKNGTSGFLNCANVGSRTTEETIHYVPKSQPCEKTTWNNPQTRNTAKKSAKKALRSNIGVSSFVTDVYVSPIGLSGGQQVVSVGEVSCGQNIAVELYPKEEPYEPVIAYGHQEGASIKCEPVNITADPEPTDEGGMIIHLEGVPATPVPVEEQEEKTPIINPDTHVYVDPVPQVQMEAVCIVKTYDTAHYPLEDTETQKGYHQQLELQQNGAEVSLYQQKCVQENFGTELMYPDGVSPITVQPFSAKYPQTVELEIMFQNLLHLKDDGTKESASVEICVGYSVDGGNTFLPFPLFIETGDVEITPEGNYTDPTGTYTINKFTGCKNKNIRYIAHKTFTFAEAYGGIKNNVVEFKIFRHSVDQSVTDTKYQYKCYFSAIRTWCYDYNATKKQYETYGTQELVIQRPIIEKYRNMTARLGFEIRAGAEIKGTIDELNVVMQSRARTCSISIVNGEKVYTWSGINETSPTNNPASLALMVLQHQMRGMYAYIGESGNIDKYFDMDSFGRFYEWCEQTDGNLLGSGGRKYTANGVLSKQMKTIDLVNQILNCGHGKLIIEGNRYAVLFDKPNKQPVMVLNNQNVLEAKNTKNFDEDIDGYSCKFIDAINDYQEDVQIFVPKDLTDPSSPNYKEPSEYKLESIELPWITDVKRAYRMCMYMLACRKLRPESWEVKMSVDGALVDVGSLVSYQSDTIAVGIGDGAEITDVVVENGYITAIKVDYGFAVADVTKTYGIKVQHSDPINGVCIRTYQLANFGTVGTKDTLVLTTPIDISTVIKPTTGDIVSFGLYEKITTDAICLSKKANEDGTYTLILVPYQEDIYMSEYGTIPRFISNVTSPKDAGVEVDSEIPKPTYEDVHDIAQAVADTGTTTPPTAPSNFVIEAKRDVLSLSCTQTGDKLSDSVKFYEFEITKADDSIVTLKSSSNIVDYTFDRNSNSDGYPESSVLNNWSFRVRAINIYDIASTWTSGTLYTENYGTWQPATPSFVSKIPSENTITFDWNSANGTGGKHLYGDVKYELRIYYNGTIRKTIVTNETRFIYSFDRNTDSYPEKIHDSNHTGLDLYTFNLKIYNESGKYAEVTAQTFSNAELQDYKTWIIPQIIVQKEVVDRTVILTAVYGGSNEVYGKLKTLVKIKRLGNTDPVDTDPEFTFNDLLGITADGSFYTPEFDKSVMTSDSQDNEPNYRKDTATDFVSLSNKISHTLPLIGQTARIFKEGNVPVFDSQNKSVFTKDVSDYSTIPQSPTEGMVIHFVGVETGFVTDAYYLYENSEWVRVNSKMLIVPTTYSYSISMTNESGSISTATDTEVTALGTNISDVVHSHEHYKEMYVEKLSAISANMGMISQGGMGSFAELLNYWALSDLSAEDSGVPQGVKKGAFRVGGADQYFKVTPLGNNQYEIELKAGNITLTTQGDGTAFSQGTYIYDSGDDTKRLALTATGIIAQKNTGTSSNPNWINVAQVRTDAVGNLIVTNNENFEYVAPFGTQVNGAIYHFDNPAYPQDEEGDSPTNPYGIVCNGSVVDTKTLQPILVPESSKKCFKGTVTKDVSQFTGNIVLFSKSNILREYDKYIKENGSVVDNKANSLNNYIKQSKNSGTVGSYLGLLQTQINNGIFSEV